MASKAITEDSQRHIHCPHLAASDMAKISISEAVGMTGVSESPLRSDIRRGKLSSEKDPKGHRRIDTAELDRGYGNLTPPPERQLAEHDNQKIIAVLENQVADLQKQLELSNDRETALIYEKSKRLDLLSASAAPHTVTVSGDSREKEEKRALMPPAEEKEKSRNWLLRRVGARFYRRVIESTCLIFAEWQGLTGR